MIHYILIGWWIVYFSPTSLKIGNNMTAGVANEYYLVSFEVAQKIEGKIFLA